MKIAFTTYVTIEQGETIKGIPSLRLPDGRRGPVGRVTTLYGTRDSLTMLRDARVEAMKENRQIYRVDLSIDGGDLPTSKMGLSDLPGIYFLNLLRLKVETFETILEIIHRPEDSNTDILDIIARDPNRLNLIWDHPTFAHIGAFIWAAPTRSKNYKDDAVQVATLVSQDIIESWEIRNFNGETEKSNRIFILETGK